MADQMSKLKPEFVFYDTVRQNNIHCKKHKNPMSNNNKCSCNYIKEPRGIQYRLMIPVLVKTIQTQKNTYDNEIAIIKERLAILENNNIKIKSL